MWRRALVSSMVLVWPIASLATDPGDDAIGQRIAISPATMPRPDATPSANNGPSVVPMSGMPAFNLPPGFAINLFAHAGLTNPRFMVTAPNGDILLTEGGGNFVTLLRDSTGSGSADLRTIYLQGFNYPSGIAMSGNSLYVADFTGVWRVPYSAGATAAPGPAQAITAPGSLGSNQGHATRTLALTPDGQSVYVGIGSINNIYADPVPRATIQLVTLATGAMSTFAAGLRNPVGLALRPGTSTLYAVVNERDTYGDELVPDYMTSVRSGAFYGWPYAYIGPNADPTMGGAHPELINATIVPDLLFRTHSAPLGIVFYTAQNFPAYYQGGAFVTFHGSWNAAVPRGYKIVFVPFACGLMANYYENFATGFRVADGAGAQANVIGRPVGMTVAADGSLLVADDASNSIWRITYTGAPNVMSEQRGRICSVNPAAP